MRVLIVGDSADLRAWWHAGCLADANEVHFADARGRTSSDELRSNGWTLHTPPGSSTDAPGIASGLSRSTKAARTMLSAAGGRSAIALLSLVKRPILGPRVHLPSSLTPPLPVISDPELSQSLVTLGLQPQVDVPWLSTVIHEVRPHIVASFGWDSGPLVTLAAKRRQGSLWETSWVLILPFEDIDPNELAASVWHSLVFQSADAVLAESPEVMQLARRLGFTGASSLTGPSAGYWLLAAHQSGGEPLARQIATAQRPRTIAIWGVHDARSQGLAALRGAALCADRLEGWRLMILDPSDGVDLAAELIRDRYNLSVDLVTTRGWQERREALLRARCLIVAADGGALPVMLEANLAGCYAIGSPVAGCLGWLVAGESATMIPAFDPAAVAEALRAYLDTVDETRPLHAGVQDVSAIMPVSTHVASIASLYEAAAGSAVSRSS